MSNLDDLYQDFKKVHEEHHGLKRRDRLDALEKANEFEGLIDGNYKILMDFRTKGSLTEDDSGICRRLESMLKEERNTWRLIKALSKSQLLTDNRLSESVNGSHNANHDSNRMDDSDELDLSHQNSSDNIVVNDENIRPSEEQIIGDYYSNNAEILRMQIIVDWLEANEASDSEYHDKEDKVKFYADGPTAWENTFHSLKAKYSTVIPDLDVSIFPNAGVELCPEMDPDAPLRTKKSLAHQDKEIEIRLFRDLFRCIRAGELDEGQKLAQDVGYHWLSALLDGWKPFEDPNLDQELLGTTAIHQPDEIEPVRGNRKRDVWRRTCFLAARSQGLNSFEKAILGVLGGNLKSVLPVCHNWADQLWARIKCSIEVKIEQVLRDPKHRRKLIELPQEFYDNYRSLEDIFRTDETKSMDTLKSVDDFISPMMEANIQQTIQKHLILNDIKGLLKQLAGWCSMKEFYDGSLSPHFLRCFTHIVLFLREINLVDDSEIHATEVIEAYISSMTKSQQSVENVAYYASYLPKEKQTNSFARLLSTISDKEERRYCLRVAKEYKLDVDEITQTVVESIRNETPEVAASISGAFRLGSMGSKDAATSPKTTSFDKRKIDAIDYLLMLDTKNFIAILHQGNILLRHFSLQRKMDAVKETFTKLPSNLNESVEGQWRVHTNSDIPLMLRNNLRELEGFRALLEAQEELAQWSEWHHKKPEEPRKPANLSKFCDNVNYEQRLKQYQHDLNIWRELREIRTKSLMDKVSQLFHFPNGWMRDLLPTGEGDGDTLMDQTTGINITTTGANHCLDTTESRDINEQKAQERVEQLEKLRRHFVPYMVFICFNILQLTSKYEDCLRLANLLANDELKLNEEFTKSQLRDFLDKICEVTKLLVKQSLAEEAESEAQV